MGKDNYINASYKNISEALVYIPDAFNFADKKTVKKYLSSLKKLDETLSKLNNYQRLEIVDENLVLARDAMDIVLKFNDAILNIDRYLLGISIDLMKEQIVKIKTFRKKLNKKYLSKNDLAIIKFINKRIIGKTLIFVDKNNFILRYQ